MTSDPVPSRTPFAGRPWHALATDEVLGAVGATIGGLSSAEAAERVRRMGHNRLPAPARRSVLRRLLAQLSNLLILVLIAAAAVTALLGHWLDTCVILGVVVVNTLIGFLQEGRAEDALDAIRHMLAPQASVIRDGRRQIVDADILVPGDIVMLEPGDKVPADLRLLKVKGLRIQEAALTGESLPVDKSVEPVDPSVPLGERRSMAYSGTLVASGQATGVVTGTGPTTEIGRISGMLTEVEPLTTPLLAQMAVFARRLTLLILVGAILIFLFGWLLRGYEATEMFMIVIGLAVAAIPEGLPAILTVTLAIGVQRMAARNAIIRRLPSVETLGAVSIICSDKTGTLTRNEMTVRSVATAARVYGTTGTGYDPHGDFEADGLRVEADEHPVLREVLRAGVLCNDSSLRHREGQWEVTGDPMEGALIVAAMKGEIDVDALPRSHQRTDVIPFDAAHRFMAVLNHDHENNGYIFVKGAPEQVISMCTGEAGEDGTHPIDRERWKRRVEEIATTGQRVLAMAMRRTDPDRHTLAFSDLDAGLVLLGLVGLIDPPREEAVAAIAECLSAGIDVKMVTGDHAATAGAIARQLGLANSGEVVTGQMLEGMDAATFSATALRADVFARTTPEHKLRLVEALQEHGRVVAMTGDGVNDAPALRRADVGVAMGRNGTEAAKEAAAMVLADDNFVSITQAVREGRTVYNNLKKAILFLLPINGGESLSIVFAVLAGVTLPITPVQILWVNMVSSVGLVLALAFEPPEPDVMRRPPRPRNQTMLPGILIWRIAFVSLLFVTGIFAMYLWALRGGASIEEARTCAVNTLVAMEVFYLFSVRYLGSGSLAGWQRLFGTRIIWMALGTVTGLQLLFTYAPFMNDLFDTRPMGLAQGVVIIAAGCLLFSILELEKWVRRSLLHHAP